ncbi:uncharacterized protein LOC111134739 [Crassostrea virginica]
MIHPMQIDLTERDRINPNFAKLHMMRHDSIGKNLTHVQRSQSIVQHYPAHVHHNIIVTKGYGILFWMTKTCLFPEIRSMAPGQTLHLLSGDRDFRGIDSVIQRIFDLPFNTALEGF